MGEGFVGFGGEEFYESELEKQLLIIRERSVSSILPTEGLNLLQRLSRREPIEHLPQILRPYYTLPFLINKLESQPAMKLFITS